MFATDHTAWNKAANGEGGLVLTGNVISDCMYGFHVRAHRDTECNGFTFPPGELQKADLKPATEGYRSAFHTARRFIESSEHFKTQNGWCYIIRHVRGFRDAVIHGIVITDKAGKLLRCMSYREIHGRDSMKSQSVVDAVLPFLAPAH